MLLLLGTPKCVWAVYVNVHTMDWLVIRVAVISDLNSKRHYFPMPNAATCFDELLCAAPTQPLLRG